MKFGGGKQLRDFTYIDDCVEALLSAAISDKSNGKVYNLGGCEVLSLNSLAEIMSKYAGGTYRIKEFPPERLKIDIGDYYSDFSMIKHDLGWRPTVKIEDGISKTIDYYKKYFNLYI